MEALGLQNKIVPQSNTKKPLPKDGDPSEDYRPPQKRLKITPRRGFRGRRRVVVAAAQDSESESSGKRGRRRVVVAAAPDSESESSDSDEDPADVSDEPADKKWLRFRRNQLTKNQHLRLQNAFYGKITEIEFLDFEESKYLAFLDRVAREYVHTWKKKKIQCT